jgi:hypothetical protein
MVNLEYILSIIFGAGSITASGFIMNSNDKNKKVDYVGANITLYVLFLILLFVYFIGSGIPAKSDAQAKYNMLLFIVLVAASAVFGIAIEGQKNIKTPSATTTGVVNTVNGTQPITTGTI